MGAAKGNSQSSFMPKGVPSPFLKIDIDMVVLENIDIDIDKKYLRNIDTTVRWLLFKNFSAFKKPLFPSGDVEGTLR